MPSISVIVPVYNTATWLPRCLESLCAQSCRDMEIICIDDGSTDGSTAIIHEYAAREHRLISIRLNSNKGAAIARNVGMAAASGEYIGFLDSDDTLDSSFYATLLTTAHQSEANIVKGNLKIGTSDGQWITSDLNRLARTSPAFFNCNFTTAIYRRIFLLENGINFPPHLPNGEDLAFLMKAVSRCNHIPVLDGCFYYYWHRQGSASKGMPSEKMLHSMMQYIDDVIEYLNKKILFPDVYILQTKKLVDDCQHLADIFANRQTHLLCAEKIITIYEKCQQRTEIEKYISFNNPVIISAIRKKNKQILAKWLSYSLIQKLRLHVIHSQGRSFGVNL